MYILERVGARTEPCSIPARISLGVDISLSTETLNLRCERKELMSSRRHDIVEIKGHVVR
jgi:hypothetical protein